MISKRKVVVGYSGFIPFSFLGIIAELKLVNQCHHLLRR
jgi:hypothetical protein